MPENNIDAVSKEWLQSELRSPTKSLIVLDCRSSNEFQEGHIRSAVNFSIPSLILKRLATGKINLTSTIKCRDLKQRIQNAYNDSMFVLYNDTITATPAAPAIVASVTAIDNTTTTSIESNTIHNSIETNSNNSSSSSTSNNNNSNIDVSTINVLHRRLKQDGCHVYWLKGKYTIIIKHIFLILSGVFPFHFHFQQTISIERNRTNGKQSNAQEQNEKETDRTNAHYC